MKGYFYHSSIRKYVLLMGNLFSGIYVARGEDQYRKVPITVSSKEQFVAALNSQELNGDGMVANVSTMLPRIGLDMVSCTYDSTRKTNVSNRKLTKDFSADRPAANRLFNPVPYDFEFEVSIYTRHQDDAFQIIEQILPYFQPAFNTMIKELNENEVVVDKRDIPIILESAVPETTFEGEGGEMRHIEWTLNMRLKGWLYPPTNSQFGEIRTIYLNFQDEETEVIHAEREPVSRLHDLAWSIRSSIDANEEVNWRASVDTVRGITWNTRGDIVHESEIAFEIKPPVATDYEISAMVRESIDSTSAIDWGTSPFVTANVTSAWGSQTLVTGTTDVSWADQTNVMSTTDVSWADQTNVMSTAGVSWTTSPTVELDNSVSWQIFDPVIAQLEVDYDVRTYSQTFTDISYNQGGDVLANLDIEYISGGRIGSNFEINYFVD